ncbi:MAG: CPBP family intramembrane metalloprotease [Oscillospiraceae bacterium]|nr:CPBP family intramembrane metalloprotease [Oscillospiraceae bacterium]
MNTVQKKPLRAWMPALYFALLLGVWFLWEFFLRRAFADTAPVLNEFYGGFVKLLVWTVPAFVLIRRFEGDMAVPLKPLFKNRFSWGGVGLYALLFLAFHAITLFTKKRALDFSGIAPADMIGPVLFAGITEEAVFRGWLLNVSLKKMRQWQAIALNAVLFLVIHFPIWLHNGQFATVFSGGGFITIMALSVVFSYVFIQTKSLVPPILLHMLWNLLIAFSAGSY